MTELSIRYLDRSSIDDDKWNRCVQTASNGLIYSLTYYLDAMANGWDGLVLGNYEMIMPLTKKKKWGIEYLYQPFLVAQSGISGNNISAQHVNLFLDSIPKQFRYWDINLNAANLFTGIDYKLNQRSNYVLDLAGTYDDLRKSYRETTIRNIKRSASIVTEIKRDLDVELVIELALGQMKSRGEDVKGNAESFRKLFNVLTKKNMTVVYGVFGPQGSLLASAVFFIDKNRAYYILVGNHPNGKTLGASHALVDAFIKDHAGSPMVLDFEGSDLQSLAFFYSSFGAANEPYPAIRLNRLPRLLQWLKR